MKTQYLKKQTHKLFIIMACVSGSLQAQQFMYNQQGQVTSDEVNGISLIEWNKFNKVSRVVNEKAEIEFVYNGRGNRVRKIVKPRNKNGLLASQSNWRYTYYHHDATGKEIARYDRSFNATSSEKYIDIFSLVENALDDGRQLNTRDESLANVNFTATNTGATFENIIYKGILIPPLKTVIENRRGEKQYDLSDYANNIASTVSDRRIEGETELLFAQDYYPYGMTQPLRAYKNEKQTKGFGGKETDGEIAGAHNAYDFGARLFDPRVARWWSIDNLYAKAPGLSPYVYADASPLSLVDPDGNEATFVAVFNKDRKGGTITISADIVVGNSTPTFIQNYKKVLAHYYTPKKWVDYKSGHSWTVKFDLHVMSTAEASKALGDAGLPAIANHFGNRPRVYVYDGRSNTGEFFVSQEIMTNKNYNNYTSEDARTLAHETGHYLGLSDRYVEKDPERQDSNEKHTKQSRREAEQYPNDLMNGGFFISATHVENWMNFVLQNQDDAVEKITANLPTHQSIDQVNGKLKGPYLSVPYVRNRNAYESIKRGEQLRKTRHEQEKYKASSEYRHIMKLLEKRE